MRKHTEGGLGVALYDLPLLYVFLLLFSSLLFVVWGPFRGPEVTFSLSQQRAPQRASLFVTLFELSPPGLLTRFLSPYASIPIPPSPRGGGSSVECLETWSLHLYNLGCAADVLVCICCIMMSELSREAEGMLGRPVQYAKRYFWAEPWLCVPFPLFLCFCSPPFIVEDHLDELNCFNGTYSKSGDST